jgi:hypothetical protein
LILSKNSYAPFCPADTVLLLILSSALVLGFPVWTIADLLFLLISIKFTLEQAMKAQWGSRGIALLFL